MKNYLFITGLYCVFFMPIVSLIAQIPSSGLQLWLKADVGVTTNMSNIVTLWTDQSGNGNDVSGTAGTFVASDAAINNQSKDNKGFYIQRSCDGINWKDLDFVKGYGITSNNYHYDFTDVQLISGINYYRLKQVDYDASYTQGFEYSTIITVKSRHKPLDLQIYPNPVTDYLMLTDEAITDATIIIYNQKGQAIQRFKMTDSTQKISVIDLQTGQYFLTLEHATGAIKTGTFIK